MTLTTRQYAILTMLMISSFMIVKGLYTMFLDFGDEVSQGVIYRILFFHVPAAISSMMGFYVGAGLAIMYLWKRDLRYDAWSAAINEVCLAFALITLFTGMIWARIAWGVWWAVGDHRLTSYLICILIYAGYLMLRRSVQDPAQRASMSSVLAIFAALDIIIVWKSIEWWRGNHPSPVLSIRTGSDALMPKEWSHLVYWNVLAIGLMIFSMVLIRLRQEQMQSEIDSVRRFAHEL